MLLPRLSLLSDQPTGDSSSHGSKCHRSSLHTEHRLHKQPPQGARSPGHSPMVAAAGAVRSAMSNVKKMRFFRSWGSF